MTANKALTVCSFITFAAFPAQPAGAQSSGQEVYNAYCMECHQANGTGVPNMQPSLKKSKKALGDPAPLIKFVLKGSADLDPSETIYSNIMPGHDFLSDSELAAVLTFIRQSFGNNAPLVSEAAVRAARAQP